MSNICHICKLVHVQIQGNCICTCLIWTCCNQQWSTSIHFTLLVYASKQTCLPHCIYISLCTSTVVNIYTLCFCTYTLKKQQQQILTSIHHASAMCQQWICPSNATYVNQSMYSCQTFMSVWCLISVHSINSDQEHSYTYISHYWHMSPNKYACHITYMYPTAPLLQSTYRPSITAHISQKITKYILYSPC